MRKIIFGGSGPTVGMEYCHADYFEDDVTDKELDDLAWHYSIENIEMYGFDYDPEAECDYQTVTNGEDIEGWWAEYNHDEHDYLLIDNPFLED